MNESENRIEYIGPKLKASGCGGMDGRGGKAAQMGADTFSKFIIYN